MRLGPPFTDGAGKPAGSPKTAAGPSSSSSSSSVGKQVTARQVAAELIRHGDPSLSAPLISASGTLDNLLHSQVGNDSADKEQRLQVFTEEQRARRLQKSRAERAEPLRTIESSASVEHTSANEHALSNAQKQKELQDMQEGKDTEDWKKEWRAKRLKAAQKEENARCCIKEPPPRGPRSLRVASLDHLPPSFTAEKKVMDMQYCVHNLSELRMLARKNKLSKFSDFWATDHKDTMPMKAAFTPENLMTSRVPLLAKFYDPGLTTTDGEADPLNPPYIRISRELIGRVIHTLRREYITSRTTTTGECQRNSKSM